MSVCTAPLAAPASFLWPPLCPTKALFAASENREPIVRPNALPLFPRPPVVLNASGDARATTLRYTCATRRCFHSVLPPSRRRRKHRHSTHRCVPLFVFFTTSAQLSLLQSPRHASNGPLTSKLRCIKSLHAVHDRRASGNFNFVAACLPPRHCCSGLCWNTARDIFYKALLDAL